MNDKPVLLGGKSIFGDKVPIVRPTLPQFHDLADDLEIIVNSGMVTKGQYLFAFERSVASHLNVKHAVAVSSCTTGLMLTYHGLDLTGDVIVPSFTFMATASAMIWCGLVPVFADVDFGTTNLDLTSVESVITPNTSAIVAVHNFGNPADIKELQEFASRRGIKLIFDAAHGFGSLYFGSPVGCQGDAQVFSLSPTKLVICGEGGIVATNDDDLAEKVRIGREYGNNGNYDSIFAGINARMSEFNALLGLHSLPMLEGAASQRNAIAAIYQEELGKIPGIGFQEVRGGNRHSYKDFSVTVDPDMFGLTRDELALALHAEKIDTRKYYSPPVHLQTAYRRFYQSYNRLTNTEVLANRSLSLPIWSCMDRTILLSICRAIWRVHKFAAQVKSFLK